jgi:hypothetical protein
MLREAGDMYFVGRYDVAQAAALIGLLSMAIGAAQTVARLGET